MKAVSDPNLLAQLNGSEQSSRAKVSDPEILAQLNAPAEADASEGGAVWNAVKGGVNWLTGNVDTEYPEAGEFDDTGSFGGNLRAAGGFITTPDDQARANILQKINPDIEVQQDRDGNVMARLPDGEWGYINKPGLSMQDFNTVVAEVLKYLPAARGGALFTGGLAKAGVTGGLSGLTSATEDALSDAMGSETGVDPVKAAFATAFGGLSEPLAILAGKAWRAMPWKKGLIDIGKGSLNQKGRAAAQAAGLDPDQITPEIATTLDDMARKGLDFTDDAQAAAAGEIIDPKRIPATLGEKTGARAQMAAEAAMESGGRGTEARAIMEEFRRKQGSSMVTASDDLSRGVMEPADAAGTVGSSLKERAGDAWQAVDEAYEQLRQTPGAFHATSYKTFVDRTLKKRFAFEGLDVQNNQAVAHATKILEKAIPGHVSKNPARGVTIKRIEIARQELLKAQKAARPEDQRVFGSAIGAVDAWYDKALRTALVKGDYDQIKKVVTSARQARKDYGQKFGKNNTKRAQGQMTDDAGAFIEKVVVGDLTNTELAAKLFEKGTRSSGTSTRVVKRLETIFGRGSEEWELLEGGAIRNLLSGKGGMLRGVRLDQNGQPMLSNDAIGTLARDIKTYLKTDYAKTLHGDNLKHLAAYADELQKFTRDKTIASISGSDQGNLRAVYDLTQRLLRGTGVVDMLSGGGVTTFAAGEAMKTASKASSRRAAENATRSLVLRIPVSPIVREMVTGSSAAAGAHVGSEMR
ncbi:hypothetical protein [Roseibium sp.]|uniref:hypothetical protein n=1 Tax=Roseibium sp. TaxID=1936156 RepID=UPI003B51C384